MLLVWRGMPDYEFDSDIPQTTAISVIVPVRNEAINIFYLLEDLNRQDYPVQNFEVIIVDDNSEDDTIKIVNEFSKKALFTLRIFALKEEGIASPSQEAGTRPDYIPPELPGGAGGIGSDMPSGKKKAIETGINYASGELIVTTDGDCRLNPGWLSILQNFYVSKAAKFISAPVSYFTVEHRMYSPATGLAMPDTMQAIEFAGLIVIGATSIAKRSPNMCNGANIAYPKKIFYQVNGFEGNINVASGDDEFLMHKIYAHGAKRIAPPVETPNLDVSTGGAMRSRVTRDSLRHAHVYFLKNREAMVFTKPAKNLSGFIAQRMRWAGKWAHYADIKVKLLAIFIFSVNFCLMASIIFIIINQYCFAPPTGRVEGGIVQNAMPYALCTMLLKVFAEFVFLKTVMKFFSKRFNYLAFVLIELIHPFYVVFLGCLSNLGGFWWKGRKVR